MIGQVLIIGIRDQYRAIAGASPAGCTFTLIYVTRLLQDFHREVARGSRNLLQGGIGDDFDVGMSVRLNEPGG